ncbi:hypothetical protein H7B90_28485 [Cohnella xylanilytica]|uniref:Deacetylase PdaC domain-containing protein n=1 Tax=Cohnella xylanilytica TaxID=557555 RepID=A0A841U8J7_9BACL|nr:hypothetical protein [Cohnella xylanilytica]MBB6695338.1 hypothetical protein [Cohnella xylanilytica]
MNRYLKIASMSCLALSLSAASVSAASPQLSSSITTQSVTPDKTEYTTTSTGQIIPVYYFNNNTKAKQFMALQQQQYIQRKEEAANSSSLVKSARATATNFVSYYGPVDYDFTNTFMSNTTNTEQSMSTTITRNHSTKTTVSVNAEFAKFFKAQVGVEFANSYQYQNTFNLKVPGKKKGLITTANHSDYYTASYGGVSLGIYRPTANETSAIYIVNLDFPET